MARIRTIKPQFWLDEDLGSIKRDARLLYIGLWNLADDRGVFEWRPAKIRIQIFPYDADITDKKIEDFLELLSGINNIVRFEENRKPFGYIPSFLAHQDIKKPSQWAFTTTLPDTTSTPLVPQQLDTSSTREKEKEKEKEKLEGKSNKTPYGEFKNVFLTLEECEKVKTKFGDVSALEKIERLSRGIASKGYKYKSHYATLLTWDRKDNGGRNGRMDGQMATRNEKPTGVKIIE
jgi:hypothetical protein